MLPCGRLAFTSSGSSNALIRLVLHKMEICDGLISQLATKYSIIGILYLSSTYADDSEKNISASP